MFNRLFSIFQGPKEQNCKKKEAELSERLLSQDGPAPRARDVASQQAGASGDSGWLDQSTVDKLVQADLRQCGIPVKW